MKVPFLDLRSAYREQRSAIDAAYRRVMESGRYVLGNEVSAFEQEFAAYCGVKHVVGVGCGLDALYLILKGYGIGPGDEVIVPANAYIATWLPVSRVGAVPVPVEPDPETFNLDPTLVQPAISPRTRAILPVHLYGQTADMDPLTDLARAHGLKVIEDGAQAHGASYKGSKAGSLGDAAAFSFYPTKNLGAFGDGGAVATDDDRLADRVRLLGNYGSGSRNTNEVRGVNSRLDPLQAAFLREQLQMLDRWNRRRDRAARTYLESLRGIDGLILPRVPEWADPVWHLFVLRSPHRDRLRQHLELHGVGTLVHYPVPPHLSPAYRDCGFERGQFPIAEALAQSVLSLPVSPWLTSEEVEHVITSVKSFMRA